MPKGDSMGTLKVYASVRIGTQLLAQKLLLEPCLDHPPERHRAHADPRERRPAKRRGSNRRHDDAGVNRMTHDPVGPGVDDAMIRLSRHAAGPQASQVNARPPREKQPGHGDGHQRPRERNGRVPQNHLAPDVVLIEAKQEHRTGTGEQPVDDLVLAARAAHRAVSPQRSSHPRKPPHEPDRPDCSFGHCDASNVCRRPGSEDNIRVLHGSLTTSGTRSRRSGFGTRPGHTGACSAESITLFTDMTILTGG